MGTIGKRRCRHTRRQGLSLLLVAAFVLLHAGNPGADGAPQDRRGDLTMRLPGGVERLLKVLRTPVPAEPARAFLAIIRRSHSEKPGPRDTGRETTLGILRVYLDGIARLQEAARKVVPDRPGSIAAFFEACGFDTARNRPSTAAAVVTRNRLLRRAGFPVEEWTTWWRDHREASAAEKVAYTQTALSALSEDDELPALLPPNVWASVLQHGAAATAAGILSDRRAALLYYGLFALDDETLSFVARSPSVVSSLAGAAGEFAAFSDALVIRRGQVELPGGQAAAPIWEQLVGAPANAPDRFISRLFSRDKGRLAWLFDVVAHLDPPHQAFALSAFASDAPARLEGLRSLYDVFAAFALSAPTFADRPFTRATPDPAFIVGRLRVSNDGRLAPDDPAFWNAVLPSADPMPTAGQRVAAWIVRQIASQPVSSRRQYLDAVLFAQRMTAAQGAEGRGALDAAASAVAAFVTRPVLMLTLERLGFADPRDYAQAASSTEALSRGDARRATLALAQFQGALTLLDRLHDVGAIAPDVTLDLARALMADPGGEASIAAWLETRLLPALPRPANAAVPERAEGQLLDALAGVTAARPLPVITWEDHAYRVDVAAGERARLRRIREKQADVDLGELLAFRRAALRLFGSGAAATPADRAALAEEAIRALPTSDLLNGNVSLFGHVRPPTRESVVAAIRSVEKQPADGRSRAEATRRLNETIDLLLADVLASFAYALATGDPETATLLAGNPARLHDFTLSMPSSVGWWRLSEEISRVGQELVVRGSLLGLERTLGRQWARPLSFDIPDIGRRMPPEDLRGMGEAITTLNPYRLKDADRDQLVAGLRRGRERLAASTGPELQSLLAQAGVEGQRRRLIGLAVARDPAALWQYLSLVEILQAGTGDSPVDFAGWGLPSRPLDGSFGIWFPPRLDWCQMAGRPLMLTMPAHVLDVQLHVAELLDELRLPSVLLPAVLSLATWDVAMSSPMLDADDWLGVVRAAQALSRDRVADYVSALAAQGALVPVEVK